MTLRRIHFLLFLLLIPAQILAENSLESATGGKLIEPASTSSQQELVDMVVAEVEGDPVTLSELKAFGKSQGRELPDSLGGNKEVATLLRDLLLSRLIEKEAAAANIAVRPAELENYLAEIRKQNGIATEEEFEKLLKAQGLTFEQYRKQITLEILRARIVQSKIRAKIQVVDEDVMRFLEANPKRLPAERAVHVQQALIPVSNSLQSASEAAETIRKAVLTGADFREQTGAHFQDLGFVELEDLRSEFRTAISSLTDSQITEPITTDLGIHLLFLPDKQRDKSGIPLALKEEIRAELYEREFQNHVQKYFTEELVKKYHIEIKL